MKITRDWPRLKHREAVKVEAKAAARVEAAVKVAAKVEVAAKAALRAEAAVLARVRAIVRVVMKLPRSRPTQAEDTTQD